MPCSRGDLPAPWLTDRRMTVVTHGAGKLAVLEGRPARVAILVAAAVLLLLRLGAIDVSAPDEPVYTEMAEEVRSFEHGPSGLVLLYLNGTPSDQKPPFYYWAA